MKFSTDWFTGNIPNFELCMKSIEGKHQTFLEIGVFEGRSTCWLLKHGLDDNGMIYCVDPFYGVKGFHTEDDLYGTFNTNTLEAKHPLQQINVFRTTSRHALAEFIYDMHTRFNFIYIDGAHDARNTLTDACMSWDLLKKGGVLLFDDYEWQHGNTEQEKPKLAIDCFLEVYEGKYELLFKNYQVAVKKL